MHDWQGCLMSILFSAIAGSQSVNGQDLKQGCIGESIKIKENISHNINDMYVSIYKTEGNTMGMWHINDSIPFILNGYSKRVVLDRRGNIWIMELVESDSDMYFIKTDIGDLPSNIEKVRLNVIVPPTKNCTPKITRKDNYLTAELNIVNNNDCGNPQVQVYWLDHPENSITKEVIKLHSGNDNGIYHACIKGVSLTCSKMSNPTEYCSIYIDSTDTFQRKSSTSSTTVAVTFPRTSSKSSTTVAETFPQTSSTSSVLDTEKISLGFNISTFLICVILVSVMLYRKRQTLVSKTKTKRVEEIALSNVASPPDEMESLIPNDDNGSAIQPKVVDGDGEVTISKTLEQGDSDNVTDLSMSESVCSDKSIGMVPTVVRNALKGVITLSRESIMGRTKSANT